MTDIVTTLRTKATEARYWDEGAVVVITLEEANNAAAEIERLRAECAELTRRMTPPPGCVRTHEGKDVKVLGEMPMTADGYVIASMFADVWSIHERTGKPYKTSLYHRGFLSKLYSTEEAAKAAIKLCYPFAENVCNNPKCNCREEKQAAEGGG